FNSGSFRVNASSFPSASSNLPCSERRRASLRAVSGETVPFGLGESIACPCAAIVGPWAGPTPATPVRSRRSSISLGMPYIPTPAYRKLHSKKNGEPFQAPRRGGGVSTSLLERESRPKGEQSHRGVIFAVGNAPGIATTIDTIIALGEVEAQDRVVKDVVSVHPELR